MCGITGFFKADLMSLHEAEDVIKSMTDSLVHRGPDASNTFIDSRGSLFMGHRRLSILDTSKGGLQPMKSKSKNTCIDGKKLQGVVTNTFVKGEELFKF